MAAPNSRSKIPVVSVYDLEGRKHSMSYPNAFDMVTHDGWTWAPDNPTAPPPKVSTNIKPNLDVDGQETTDEDEDGDDSEDDSPTDEEPPNENRGGLAMGNWSGLTREQAFEKATELEIKVDKRWNRARIIAEIEAALSN